MQNINDILQNKNSDGEENLEGGQTFIIDEAQTNQQSAHNPSNYPASEALLEEGGNLPASPQIIQTPEVITEEGEEAKEELEEKEAEEGLVKEEKGGDEEGEGAKMSASKFLVIKDIIENVKKEISKIEELLGASVSETEVEELSKKLVTSKIQKEAEGAQKITEGVFDGQKMVGEDGNHYAVPPNYASKSKMVEGDLLKLTIKQDGSFVYKQIAPIDRKRVVGILAHDAEHEQYYVLAEGKSYKVLQASVTYFKGEPGDEVTILVPRDTPAQWGAVDNILKK